jgi:hypothetical protein
VVFSITVSGILSNTLINAPLPDIISAFGRGDGAAGLLVAAATLRPTCVAGDAAAACGRPHAAAVAAASAAASAATSEFAAAADVSYTII